MLCAAVLYAGGIRVDFVKNPLGIFMDGGPEYIHFPLVISLIITVIWIVGITNTVNLIDGLDGLAAGVAVIASGYISYAAVLSGQYGVALAMIAVTGGALGFLPFNFHPAKIFMGDSGSLYLGFMIAAISVLGSTKGATLIVTIVPFLALGLPIFDTAFAIIRRWMNGTPIMEADKGHVHHRIMNTGIGQRRTVLIMYCISAVMGMVAIMVVKREFLEAVVLTAVAAVLLSRLCGGSFQPQSDYARRGIYCGGKERRIRKKREIPGTKRKNAKKVRRKSLIAAVPEICRQPICGNQKRTRSRRRTADRPMMIRAANR